MLNVQVLTLKTVGGQVLFLSSVMDDETDSESGTETQPLMVRVKPGCRVSPCSHARS